MFIFELDKMGKRRRVTIVAPIILAHFPHFVNMGKKIKKFFSKFRLTKYVGYDIMESLGAPKESAPPFYHFQIDLSREKMHKKTRKSCDFLVKFSDFAQMLLISLLFLSYFLARVSTMSILKVFPSICTIINLFSLAICTFPP